ncbi:MAG: AraC family transcriptional regulator [Dehalococcoidales bacterium]|nr:AraC family transcriptional regulator [Dehalococcoidales bacterium]
MLSKAAVPFIICLMGIPGNNRKKYLREEYFARVNRVMDFIENNIDRELSLNELAGIAGFSPFHFHRIFSALTGETINGFIQRIRVEKAASMLVQNPRNSITGIALDCGFSGASVFARKFKEYFGMSASDWRAGGYLKDDNTGKTNSNIRQLNGNHCKDFNLQSSYSISMRKQLWRVEMENNNKLVADVEIREIPEMHVAYLRHIGPYAGDADLFGKLFNRLCTWAGPRGLLNRPDARFIALYHDNPEITDEKKLRTDVCLTVPPETMVDGEIGKAVIPAGKYAAAHFEINTDQYSDAWNAVYGGWLPESGYQPDDGPCFELYLNDPKDHPEGKCVVDICIPVKPL